jgi:prepilin-type N-terminal cleavage/methylation domain-containing protein
MIVIKMHKNENGFTILEIIAVLVIMGILIAVAVSRSVNVTPELYAGADTLRMHLRYAQTLAMNSTPTAPGVPVIWGIGGNANSYWLFPGIVSNNPANYVRLPEEDKYVNADKTINLPAKKIGLGGNFTVLFDDRGIPYTAYTDATTNTPLANNLTITVSPTSGGAAPINVIIMPLTGYVQ